MTRYPNISRDPKQDSRHHRKLKQREDRRRAWHRPSFMDTSWLALEVFGRLRARHTPDIGRGYTCDSRASLTLAGEVTSD